MPEISQWLYMLHGNCSNAGRPLSQQIYINYLYTHIITVVILNITSNNPRTRRFTKQDSKNPLYIYIFIQITIYRYCVPRASRSRILPIPPARRLRYASDQSQPVHGQQFPLSRSLRAVFHCHAIRVLYLVTLIPPQ